MVRLALNVMPEGPIERTVELARLAETLGYERCWVYDEGLAARDVYVTMTAIAMATSVPGDRAGHHQPLHAPRGHHRKRDRLA